MSHKYTAMGYDGCSCIEQEPEPEETAVCCVCYKHRPIDMMELDNADTGEMICEDCIEKLKNYNHE